MKINKSFLFFFLFANIFSFGQNNFKIGFRDEVGFINHEFGNINKTEFFIIPIQNIYITANLDMSTKFIIQLRSGMMLSKHNYEGFETGLFLFYNIPSSHLYVNSGVNFHFNIDTEGNSGGSGETSSFIGLGIGYKLSNIIALEISDHIPIKSKYGFFKYNNDYLDHKVLNIFKFGISIKITGNSFSAT